jgi:hypothetical protein
VAVNELQELMSFLLRISHISERGGHTDAAKTLANFAQTDADGDTSMPTAADPGHKQIHGAQRHRKHLLGRIPGASKHTRVLAVRQAMSPTVQAGAMMRNLSTSVTSTALPTMLQKRMQPLTTSTLPTRHHKRRWRAFGGGRRKGKGKGKGGKDKKGGKHYYADPWADAGAAAHDGTPWFAPDSSFVYRKGKGKGKSGPRTSGNPMGRDGVKLKCSLCNSTQHFRAFCPTRPAHHGKGGSQQSSFCTATPPSLTSTFGPPPATREVHEGITVSRGGYGYGMFSGFGAGGQALYYGTAQTNWPTTDAIDWCLGQSEVMISGGSAIEQLVPFDATSRSVSSEASSSLCSANTLAANSSGMKKSGMWAFAWWLKGGPIECYHTAVRLGGDREGLPLDSGALSNLSGSRWLQRCEELAKRFGHGTSWRQLTKSLSVEGVGKDSQSCSKEATVPLVLAGGQRVDFTTAVLDDSDIPALLGWEGMCAHEFLLDVYHRKLYVPGKGGYKLTLSPGSQSFNLFPSASGHLLLPCSEWASLQATQQAGGDVLHM